jgi:hypothetical protein
MKYLGEQFDRSLAFNKHVGHVIIKARRVIAAMRVMAAANCIQRYLFLLYQGLVLSVIEFALAILTQPHTIGEAGKTTERGYADRTRMHQGYSVQSDALLS